MPTLPGSLPARVLAVAVGAGLAAAGPIAAPAAAAQTYHVGEGFVSDAHEQRPACRYGNAFAVVDHQRALIVESSQDLITAVLKPGSVSEGDDGYTWKFHRDGKTITRTEGTHKTSKVCKPLGTRLTNKTPGTTVLDIGAGMTVDVKHGVPYLCDKALRPGKTYNEGIYLHFDGRRLFYKTQGGDPFYWIKDVRTGRPLGSTTHPPAPGP
ncbi:hypothetical protein ABZX75_33520 [Streptomyces sp. NPDC003038]|uniref:hypothetical protein n=1 Tax=unclassified Streptomyces TaxID=2593676 RepID=UPI0033A25BD7